MGNGTKPDNVISAANFIGDNLARKSSEPLAFRSSNQIDWRRKVMNKIYKL